jgi:hypothetical protein
MFADLSGIREKVRTEMNKVLRGIDVVRKLGLDVFQIVTCRVEGIKVQMECMMSWRRDETNPCVYYVYYPMDAESLIFLKDLGSRIPLLGSRLKGKDLHVARILQERKLIESLQKFSFVEMKIDPNTVTIETVEVDGVVDEKKEPKAVENQDQKTQEGQA